MSHNHIIFARNANNDFDKVLRKRVNNYFKENNKSRYGNTNMVVKTIFMILLYFTPYFVMLFGNFESIWAYYLCWAFMGLGIAGIGLSVMHDANHEAYSRKKGVNRLFGGLLFFLGGLPENWRIQHNILHHTYTNVEGQDEDIDPGVLLRFSPHKKYYGIYRFQHLYAWFLYGLMTLSWITFKDFKQLSKYKELDLIKTQKQSYAKLMTVLVISKIGYYAFILGVPFLVLDVPWWAILSGFFIMHFVAGMILACIFQTAHVMPTVDYPMPDDKGKMENNWLIHQLYTTANFAPKSRVFSWLIGGLNYQIEHHLFPNICHVHYKDISKIVEQTAKEYNLPYNSEPTFLHALLKHGQMLKILGKKNATKLAYS